MGNSIFRQSVSGAPRKAKMLIPTKDRIAIYTRLFQDGVMVAKKDYNNKHMYLDMPNIWVWHAMRSLDSRGYVKSQFNWQYHYHFLTNEGIEYLRSYLHLPDDIVPNTLKKARGGEDGERDPRRDDRPPREGRAERQGGRGRGGFAPREGGRGFGGADKKAGGPSRGGIGFKR